MWWRLHLATSFILGTHAFTHAVVRWGGLPARRPVLETWAIASRNIAGAQSAVERRKLTIEDRSSGISTDAIPHFTLRPDKTIVYDGLGLCVTANGRKIGSSIFVDPCTGGADQSWDWLPSGRKNLIQLASTNLCVGARLVASDKGDLNAASIALQKCDDAAAGSWLFEEALPTPKEDSSPRLEHSPMLAAVICSSFGLATMILSFGLRSWQQQPKVLAATSTQGGAPLLIDQGGVSLAMPLAMTQDTVEDSIDELPKAHALNGQTAHRTVQDVPIIDTLVEEDFLKVQHLKYSDPHEMQEDKEKAKKATEFKLNVGEAVDRLNSDIPAIFQSEPYWGIYADDLELDLQMVDPNLLELMSGTPMDVSTHARFQGLDANKGAHSTLRTFHQRHVDWAEVQVRTRLTYDSNGEQIIAARWSAKLCMKSMEPIWASKLRAQLFGWQNWPQKNEVIVDAVSKFYFNSDGRIQRHVVDTVNFNPPRHVLHNTKAVWFRISRIATRGVPAHGIPNAVPM